MLFFESMAIRVKPIILWCKYRRSSLSCDALSVWCSILYHWPISGEKILWGRNPKVWTVFGVCCIIWILPIFTKIHPKMQGVGLKALLDLSDESCNKVKVSKLQLIKSSHDSGLIPSPHLQVNRRAFTSTWLSVSAKEIKLTGDSKPVLEKMWEFFRFSLQLTHLSSPSNHLTILIQN